MQPMQPNANLWNIRDDVSFEDSERFEEDSQVSLDDSIDGSQQNWRGWTDSQSNCEAIQPGISCLVYQYHNTSGRFSSASTRTVVPGNPTNSLSHHPMMTRGDNSQGSLLTLSEISARVCAEKWSFQRLEEMYAQICITRAKRLALPPPTTTIPEKIFLSFIVHCFPQSTDEIRMYSTLANGSSEQYEFGSTLYEWGHVCDVSQTGFLLSGNVSNSQVNGRPPNAYEKDQFHVTVKVDRCRIVECTCECSNRSSWCKHVVALCIYRINQRGQIKFNETIADAINSMSDFDLRRLVQWHINEIPRKCIPGFQKLIDQIKDPNSMINRLHGAPDPTDGGHEPISRYDFPEIENKVRRLLCKYCVPAPSVHCDVSYLINAPPHPTFTEWNAMMKPYRSREPEGMWNLLQMIREMFARNDDNAVALLRTVTDECLSNNQILLWWYITKLTQSGDWTITNAFKIPHPQPLLSQLNCAQLLDEVVVLWKLVAINPRAGKDYRSQLVMYLQDYHRTAVNRLKSMITMTPPTDDANPKTDATILSNHQTSAILSSIVNDAKHSLSSVNMKFNLRSFPGFYPAIQMCHYLNDKDVQLGKRTDAVFYVAAPNTSSGYKLVPPAKEKVLKKKKKQKKMMKRREEEAARRYRGEPRDQYQGIDGIWRVVADGHAGNNPENDSTESGQESDIQKTPVKPVEVAQKKKKHLDAVEMEVNEVLAAAFTPLDTLETRFLRVEAYGTHGFRADAVDYSLKVVEYLIDSLAEQSVDFRRFDEEMDKDIPSTSSKPISSSSSSSSSDCHGADRDEEIAKGNLFLATLEKILYVTKVLRDSPHLQRHVFDIVVRTLAITKWPLYTKHQQIYLAYLDTEFVAILDQLWQSVPMGEMQMEQIREKARHFVRNENHGEDGELPPLALTKFLFLALYWTEPTAPPARHHQNGPAAASQTLQQNRRLLQSTDSDLALHCALTVVGCRPKLSDQYVLHWETIRKDKSDLTALLLTRYKDSQERCALVIDKILDPKMHRMYQHHVSNAAYFLERCPTFKNRFKPGQRPFFPFKEEIPAENTGGDISDESSDPFVDYEAQIDAELQKMSCSDSGEEVAGPLSREQRVSRDSIQSSSSDLSQQPGTSRSSDSAEYNPAHMPGLTKENRETFNALRKAQGPTIPPRRKRTVQTAMFDPRNLVTEAHVFHTFELAKKILFEAGGQQNTIIWGNNNNVGGINRRLHLCAIVIAVYALGMSNRISPSWNTRTYNVIACWVSTQVNEIGSQAIEIIREIWMAHFTPNEIANIADKSTPVTDPAMKHETAKLALSVLPFAHALTDDEVINAIKKCREDGRNMLVAGLLALDTPQFRQIGRTRTLFFVMQHWHDLSYDEEARNQPPPPMFVNPFMNVMQMGAPPPPPPPQQQQQQQQDKKANRNRARNRRAPHHLQVPPPLPQAALLYPQAYRSDVSRLHQSHSAPQLGGHPGEMTPEDHMAQPPMPANHQNMPQPSPTNALLNAYYYGMRGMDCMATSPGEERQMYLKFGPHPPYSEDLMCLFTIAKNLGGQYLYSFYSNAARSVISPYILHQYARDSVAHFPHRYNHNQFNPPQNRGPLPLINPTQYAAMFAQAPANVRYPNIKFSLPGQITNLFISNGYQPVTGELFERCCEQYLQAIINKMNSPRVNDNSEFLNQMVTFVTSAHDAFKWIPNIGRQLFEDFVRVFKRQKSYRKECAQTVNQLLGQLCSQ